MSEILRDKTPLSTLCLCLMLHAWNTPKIKMHIDELRCLKNAKIYSTWCSKKSKMLYKSHILHFFMETWEIKAAIFPRENSRGKLVKLYDSSRESAYTYTFCYHGAHSETKRSFCANTNILKEKISYENCTGAFCADPAIQVIERPDFEDGLKDESSRSFNYGPMVSVWIKWTIF